MNKIKQFFEEKGYLLISIFLVIQILLCIMYSVIFFLKNQDLDIKYNIYMCGSMFLFLIFMIHFAYHSVKAPNLL